MCSGHMTSPVVCCVFMWCGWCGWLNGVLVTSQVGLFGSLGHAVWCVHRVVCAAVCFCMLCDVMFVGEHVFAAIARERGGRGAGKHLIFFFQRRSRELF